MNQESLEQKLTSARTEKQEAEARQKREEAEAAEAKNQESLRSELSELKIGQQELMDLRREIVQGSKTTSEALTVFTQKKGVIGKIFKEHQAELADMGVESKEEMLESETLQEEPEVKDYHGAQEELKKGVVGLRGARKTLRQKGVISEKMTKEQEPITYNETIIQDIDQKLSEVNSRIAEVWRKTKEYKRIVEWHKSRYYDPHRVGLYHQLSSVGLVEEHDISDAKTEGEDLVKLAVRDSYHGQIDQEFNKKRQEKGLDVMASDLELMKSWKIKFYELKKLVDSIDGAFGRGGVMHGNWTEEIARTLRQKEKGLSEKTSETQARSLLTNLFNYTKLSGDSNTGPLAEGFLRQWQERVANSFVNSDRNLAENKFASVEQLPDLDGFLVYSRELKRFIDLLVKKHKEEGYDITSGEINDSLRQELGEIGKIDKKPDLEAGYPTHQITRETLKKIRETHYPLDELASVLREQERKLAKESDGQKGVVDAAIEMQWVERAKSQLQSEHREIYDILKEQAEIERLHQAASSFYWGGNLEMDRKRIDEIKEEIAKFEMKKYARERQPAELSLLERTPLEQQVTVKRRAKAEDKFHLDSFSSTFSELRQANNLLTEKLGTIWEEVAKIKERLRQLDQEGKGFLGLKAGRIKLEKEKLKKEHERLEKEGHGFQEKWKIVENLEYHLKGALQGIITNDRTMFLLGKKFEGKTITVQQLLDQLPEIIQEARDAKLSPERKRLLDQYQELERLCEGTKKNFETVRTNF